MADFIGAVDQGTTSTRFIVFDHDGMPVASHQLEHDQIPVSYTHLTLPTSDLV